MITPVALVLGLAGLGVVWAGIFLLGSATCQVPSEHPSHLNTITRSPMKGQNSE